MHLRRPPRSNLIRRVYRGIDWDVKPVIPTTETIISPEIKDLLSTPSWSVRSLLPPPPPLPPSQQQSNKDQQHPSLDSNSDSEINPTKLRHLLKLSALPPPSTPKEEATLLKSLKTHIHFVRAIQAVDTTDIEPLVNIRDETDEGIEQKVITLADLQPYLDQEEKVGRNGTVRRRGKVDLEDEGIKRKELRDWWVDVWRLGAGGESRRKGNYLYVRREKTKKMKQEESMAGRVVIDGEQDKILEENKNG